MKLLSICHKTAAWYVKISLTGLHSLPKEKKNLFAEPASTLEHYRRNVLMHCGVEGRAPGGSVMAFSVFRTNQHWFLSVLRDAIRFIGRQTACKETGKRQQWWRGIFPDPDAALVLWALSGHVSGTWVEMWTLSWNLCEDVFRNGYGELLPSLLEEGWGTSLLQEWALGETSFDGHIFPAALRAAQPCTPRCELT